MPTQAESEMIARNIKKLEDLIARNPSATHVYMRRTGMDGSVIDIPIQDHAIPTIRNNPTWEVVSSNETMDEDVAALFKDPAPDTDLPPDETPPAIIPSELNDDYDVPPKPSEEIVLPPKPKKPTMAKPKAKKAHAPLRRA